MYGLYVAKNMTKCLLMRGVHQQRFNCTYICNIAKNSLPVDLRTQMILKCKAFLFDHQISTYSKRNLPVNKTRKKNCH